MTTEIATQEQVNEYGIEIAKAQTIEQSFATIKAETNLLLEQYVIIINEEITPEVVNRAGDLRKKLMKCRTGVADIHKSEKAFTLAYGKFLDAIKNRETAIIEDPEEKLRELENHYINLEKIAKEQRTIARLERVSKFKTGVQASQVADLEDETFEMLLAGFEKKYQQEIDAELLRLENIRREEEQAKQERLAREALEKQEREEQALENVRLKAEKYKIEIQAKKDKEAADKLLLEHKQKADSELAKIVAQSEQIAQDQQKENMRIQSELDARNKLEKDSADKKAADELAQKQVDELAKKAPIKEKLLKWISEMSVWLPEGESENPVAIDIMEKFKAYKVWAKKEIETKM